MPRFRIFSLFLAVAAVSLSALAQRQEAPPKPQTARQALIEMVTKGALEKHLTTEVQEILKSKGKKNALGLGMLNSFTLDSGLQAFESGEVLFAYNDSAQHTNYEVHVDNDDLAGNEDSLSLSIHSFRDGKEQDNEWSFMSSHITVTMKLQQNVWRIDKVSVGAEFPVGDPKFFESAFMKMASGETSVADLQAVAGRVSSTPETPAPAMPPEQSVRMLAFAESAFARLHPDAGFTCTLSDLAQWAKMVGVDQQVTTGTSNGYHFALSGCEGKPAGSFQIIAEPLVAGKGAKAFCTDATQNLRESEDGQGSTCLATGKVPRSEAENEESGGMVGFQVIGSQANPKK